MSYNGIQALRCMLIIHRRFEPLFIMAVNNINNCGEINLLTKRVTKAENRLKLLMKEIEDIKSRINVLQSASVGETSRLFSTNDVSEFLRSESSTDDSNIAKRRKVDFPIEDEYVVVFADGACENNGKHNAKAGLGVWFSDNHPCNVSEPVKGRPTNNTAEIQACIAAAKIASKNCVKKLCIKTDSQFVINSMTQWITRWKTNSWKLASGGPVKNKEDFMELDAALKQLEDVKWVHIRGHSGIKGNEEADRLARLGASRYVS